MRFQTTIFARIPRTNCPDCGVLNVHLPWAAPHGRFTLLFEAFAIRVLQASSVGCVLTLTLPTFLLGDFEAAEDQQQLFQPLP